MALLVNTFMVRRLTLQSNGSQLNEISFSLQISRQRTTERTEDTERRRPRYGGSEKRKGERNGERKKSDVIKLYIAICEETEGVTTPRGREKCSGYIRCTEYSPYLILVHTKMYYMYYL